MNEILDSGKMEVKREMNIKLHGTETSAGYETDKSFGKVFNPWIILSQIKGTCDTCDGLENKESKLIACSFTDSGKDSVLYGSGSRHSSFDSNSKCKSASSSSDSGSCSTLSRSSSSASSASSICEKQHITLNNPSLTVEEHREFVMKVKNLQLLTLTAVRTKYKSKYVMIYIISNTEHNVTDNRVRLYDKVLAVNGKQLSEHGFDIEGLVNFTDSTDDGVFNIDLQLRRWVPLATQPGRYHIKDISVQYTIMNRPGIRNPKLSKLPQSSEKRKIKDLRWVGHPRKVVLRMDEYTGVFVFVDDDNDLRIGTIPRGDKYYYHFLVRPFTCIVKSPNKDWISQGGVTFTYHHNNIYLDITSDLENGETELGVKDHRPFNIEKPDERFFLKHKNDEFDPDSQRYESLLYQGMCFKFDKKSKTFMLKRFHATNPSVGEYFFETYSISLIENEENVPLEIPCEDITTFRSQKSNPRTLIQSNQRRKRKSLFRTFRNLLCCSVRQDLAEVGDRYVKDDNDDVLKYFKHLKDVPERSERLIKMKE